jgi:hypothetical protein
MTRIIRKEIPTITRLISYQDTEVHAGTIYKAAGWTRAVVNDGQSWSTSTRKRNKEQSLAAKARWELVLNK